MPATDSFTDPEEETQLLLMAFGRPSQPNNPAGPPRTSPFFCPFCRFFFFLLNYLHRGSFCNLFSNSFYSPFPRVIFDSEPRQDALLGAWEGVCPHLEGATVEEHVTFLLTITICETAWGDTAALSRDQPHFSPHKAGRYKESLQIFSSASAPAFWCL